jgi:hypothetical protein
VQHVSNFAHLTLLWSAVMGSGYPMTKPQATSTPFSGDNDFRSAQAHIRQTVMAIKRGLRPDDWAALVAWLKEERWETHH